MEFLAIFYILTLNYIATDAYARVERAANCPRFTDDEFPGGRVKYRRKGTRAVFRCPKKFDRYGAKFATCQSDGTWSNAPPLCTKSGCVPLDPSQVKNLDMEVVNGAVVKFSCLENYLLIGVEQAYCNGKDWSAPLPRCAAPHELTECDFEDDLCGWTQDDNEEQDWILHVGSTQTGNTGPKHDHTLGDTGNGHYLYFETSNPTMTGHQANLLSPMYTEDLSPMCFDFWYHILGPDEEGHVGSLQVFVLDQSQYIDDDDVKPLFYIDGNQGDQWHRGDIFIAKQDEPFQIAIVATRALSYISDIAIDDVRLHNCSKSTTSPPVTSSTSSTTTTSTTTTTTSSSITSAAGTQTTVTTKKTAISSPTTVLIETTTITKTPTETTVKKETTTTKIPETTDVNTKANGTGRPVTTVNEATTVMETSSSFGTPQSVTSSTKPGSSSKVPTERQTSKTTPKPSFTDITMAKTTTTLPEILTTTPTIQTTTQTTNKVTTPQPKTQATSGTQTIASSSKISSSTPGTTSSTKSTISSTEKSPSTTSAKSSKPQTPKKQKSTTESSTKSSSTPPDSRQTSTSYEKTTVFSSKKSSPEKSSFTSSSTFSSSTSSTFSSSSSSSSSSSTSFSSSSSSSTSKGSRYSSSSTSTFASTSGPSYTMTTKRKTEESKQPTTTTLDKTTSKPPIVAKDEFKSTDKSDKTSKQTKRSNEITTKTTDLSKESKDNTITVSEGRSQHPEDDTLKPLMIGLCVGIVSGLIIIGVIAYVCVRRRKFYTSRHEDELKPITNSASLQSLNNGHFYQDEEYESES